MIEAAAWAGVTESEFYAMTPRYLQAVIKGKTDDMRGSWIIARQTAYWSILPHMGKQKIKPTALGRFDWEKVVKVNNPYQTKEEMKADIDKFLKICDTIDFKPVE